MNEAAYHLAVGSRDQALTFLTRALDEAEKPDRSDGMRCLTLTALGDFYQDAKAYEKAESYYKQVADMPVETFRIGALSALEVLYGKTGRIEDQKKARSQKATLSAKFKTVNAEPYMIKLQTKIKFRWHPPYPQSSKYSVAKIVVDNKSGILSALCIGTSSGDRLQDAAAFKAVAEADPFEPLPEGLPDPVVIHFSFDINAGRWPSAQRLSEQKAQDNLAQIEKRFSPTDPEYYRQICLVANMYREQRNIAKAEPLYETALKGTDTMSIPDVNMVMILTNSAKFYALKRDDKKADTLFKRAAPIAPKIENNFPETASFYYRAYGNFLNNTKRPTEANQMFAKVKQIMMSQLK